MEETYRLALTGQQIDEKLALIEGDAEAVSIKAKKVIAGTATTSTDSALTLTTKDYVDSKTNNLTEHASNTTMHITADERTKWNKAEQNVQSNWNETNTTSDAYIKNKPSFATVATSGSYDDLTNKPTIPTVNNATLTIQKNGAHVATFTANSSSNATANITVPTKVSELDNDSKFTSITVDEALSSTSTNPVQNKVINTALSTKANTTDLALHSGNTNIHITSDERTNWNAAKTHADSTHAPSNAQKNVQSDWNATSTTSDAYIKNKPTLATVATSGSYLDLINKPEIPTGAAAWKEVDIALSAGSLSVNLPTSKAVADFAKTIRIEAGRQSGSALGNYATAEGYDNIASGDYSHAGGKGTVAKEESQTVIGSYNVDDSQAKLVVGCGYGNATRQNCFSTGHNGTESYIKIGSTLLTESMLSSLLNLTNCDTKGY